MLAYLYFMVMAVVIAAAALLRLAVLWENFLLTVVRIRRWWRTQKAKKA